MRRAWMAACLAAICGWLGEGRAGFSMLGRDGRQWLMRVFEAARAKGLPADGLLLVVSVSKQHMVLLEHGHARRTFRVSTSRFGIGNRRGSNRTPRGLHRIAERIGEGHPPGRVFVARQATSKVTGPAEWQESSSKDCVLTRILWLEGLERGVNRGKGIGSHERFIYIHGTNQEHLLGTPASHGCIRMANADVIELFDLVKSRHAWCWVSPNVPVKD